MKFLIYLFGIWLVFTVFVTVFALSARKQDVRSLSKVAWVLICLFVPFIGGLLYLALGRPLPTPDDYRPSRGNTRTVAPDDDPDFLRRLAKRLREDPNSRGAATDGTSSEAKADDDDLDGDDDSGDSKRPKGGDLPNV